MLGIEGTKREIFFIVFPLFDLIFSMNTYMIMAASERGKESQRKEG
jgi:hypothetical protein